MPVFPLGSSSILLLATLFLVSVLGTEDVAGNRPMLSLIGRFYPGVVGDEQYATLPQTFSWSASSATFSFTNATRVDIRLEAKPHNEVTPAISWFRIIMDGRFAADVYTTYAQESTGVRINTTTDTHIIQVQKVNEPSKGDVTLKDVTLGGGSFVAPPSPPKRKILFFGDSYSTGFGNAGAHFNNTCKPDPDQISPSYLETCTRLKLKTEQECADFLFTMNGNGFAAFPAVVAESFDADFQVMAVAGSGMVGYSYGMFARPDYTLEQLQQYWPTNELISNRYTFSDTVDQYPHTWKPEVVVVGSGTNDWQLNPPPYSLSNWLVNATRFITEVSHNLDHPHIVLVVMPDISQYVNNKNVSENNHQYQAAMAALYVELTRQKLPKVHLFHTPADAAEDARRWCRRHLSAVAHVRLSR